MNITQCLPTVAIGILLGLLPASAQFNMREFLEEHRVGEHLQIWVDQDAVQANDNSEKPFEWSPLIIKDVLSNVSTCGTD